MIKCIFPSEQKLVIVMEAQRREYSIAELCRKHGKSQITFYKWNNSFMVAVMKRLSGDTTGETTPYFNPLGFEKFPKINCLNMK